MINLFKKKIKIIDGNNDKESVEEAYIILMLEIARLDGKIDDSELNQIKKNYKKIYGDDNFLENLNRLSDEAENESSLHPFIEIINTSSNKDNKIEALKAIWEVILADGIVDPYEESLFMQIGDLLKIKRSDLVKIKNLGLG
ncbi:MAG: hypothetical protein DBW96_02415 [SAR86 cluster bacterium]|uniref:Co-chaperone DjlA N-terminal domain-containing protein n=1 Tax=SAR86 cluster bacterium TaxID=2030880 RepID=A0A368BVN4_9GAMM|nr:MAG: hypothetical protein DBW96_02415 [SAR86 cluster bacterium]